MIGGRDSPRIGQEGCVSQKNRWMASDSSTAAGQSSARSRIDVARARSLPHAGLKGGMKYWARQRLKTSHCRRCACAPARRMIASAARRFQRADQAPRVPARLRLQRARMSVAQRTPAVRRNAITGPGRPPLVGGLIGKAMRMFKGLFRRNDSARTQVASAADAR